MVFSDVRFETPLDLRREIDAVRRDGARVEAILLADYVVTFTWNDLRRWLRVPRGFAAAPSVPPELHGLVPFWGGLFEASIVHDWCYWTRCFDPLCENGKLAADNLFLALLRAGSVTWWDSAKVYAAVRAFGLGMYEANTFKAGSGPVFMQSDQRIDP